MFLQEQKKTSIISDVSVFITAVPLIKLFAWGEGSGGHVCVFITAVPIRKLFARGEGDSGGHVCVFITAVPITKLFAWGEEGSGGHVLRETTIRGLSELVCPSHVPRPRDD